MYLSNTGTESEDFGPLKIGLRNHRTLLWKMGPVLSLERYMTRLTMRRWMLLIHLRIPVT